MTRRRLTRGGIGSAIFVPFKAGLMSFVGIAASPATPTIGSPTGYSSGIPISTRKHASKSCSRSRSRSGRALTRAIAT